jgi:hypothetical protein
VIWDGGWHLSPMGWCGRHTIEGLGPESTPTPDTAIDDGGWYLPPELVSLFGTALWDDLDAPARRRLARYEAALLASSTVHGEHQVLGGLAREESPEPFVEVFAEEEQNHQQMFTAYLEHLRVPLLPTRAVSWSERPFTELEFYACVQVFEDVVGQLNRAVARDERTHPVARAVNRAHAVEEAVHLRYGQLRLAGLLSQASPEDLRQAGDVVSAYLRAVWRERYRSDVYALAGLGEPWSLAAIAWDESYQRRLRVTMTEHALRELTALGLDAGRVVA